jgi:nicotinamidase/pyrazinamidase
MSDENASPDLLEFILAGRPERLSDLAVAQWPPEQRAAVGAVANAIATLGIALEPVNPTAGLRDRVLATIRSRWAHLPRRALLVCDMIRDHLTPGCRLEVPRARGIVDTLAQRIADARRLGTPVVYILDRHEPGDLELEEWGTHAVEGSEGAEVWPPLTPMPSDRIVIKPSYSGFYNTTLEKVLDELAVDTLMLTGCATEVQLMSTATDALQRGFAVEVPADSQAGNSELGEGVTMAVLAALAPYAPARAKRLEKIAHGS